MIGATHWAIAEGYIPPDDTDKPRALVSHEACCILNASEIDAEVAIMIYFTDREPAGPFNVSVPACRTAHLRFNDFREPEAIPPGINFASTISSSVPIVVQHTRLDSRSGPIALMTTTAYAGG